jgi:photosystem II stability/assembly factor-like uncharacterized protein
MTVLRILSLPLALAVLAGVDANATTYPARANGAAALAASGSMQSDEHGRHASAIDQTRSLRPAQSQGTALWDTLGPPGGDITSVAASPNASGVVLAGTAPQGQFGGTLHRSTDAGASWTDVADLAATSVYGLAFASDGTAYAATQDSLWKSTDDGASWTQLALDLGLNDSVDGVSIDPNDDSTVWACVGAATGQQTMTVLRSIDAGASWEDRTPPDHNMQQNCGSIAIDPADSNTVVAGFRGDFGGGEVWVSADAGATWTDRSDGLSGQPIFSTVFAGPRLLAGGGMTFGSQYLGLFASDDLGVTWTALHDDSWSLLVVNAVAVDPANPQNILAATGGAGLNRSSDGGATWQLVVQGSAGLSVTAASFAPTDSSTVFIGATSLGVFKSSDAAATFAQASNGISELALYSIAASPLDPDAIAAAFQGQNNGGVFASTDHGATWTLQALPPTRYSKVGFAPDGTLYAISSGPTTVAQEGLYKRGSDGSWVNLGPDQGPFFESDLDVMRFSANDPNLIYLGGADFGAVGFGDTVWRSTDAGTSWTKVYDGADNQKVYDIEIVADGSDQNVVASYDGQVTAQQGGVIRSTDSGTTWNDADTGLPDFARIPKLCQTSAATPALYLSAATTLNTSAVFRSDDGGASWSATGWDDPNLIADIACDALDADTLYIARSDLSNPVSRSTDAGVSFSAWSDGLGGAGYPNEIVSVANADASQILLATTKGSFIEAPMSDTIFADGFEQ